MDTCKANLIQHSSAVAGNSRVPAKAGGWGAMTTVWEGQSAPKRSTPIPRFMWSETCIVCLTWCCFRMEWEACILQRPHTSLKITLHLEGNPLHQNQNKHHTVGNTPKRTQQWLINVWNDSRRWRRRYLTWHDTLMSFVKVQMLLPTNIFHCISFLHWRSTSAKTRMKVQAMAAPTYGIQWIHIPQYMKIYGSIHIHSCYKLTAYLNNLHFMQVWKYHL